MEFTSTASNNISIKGLNKVEILISAYNTSKPLGAGFLDPNYNSNLTLEKAELLIQQSNGRLDYVQGRILKINLSSDHVDPRGYDRDNGQGAFAACVEAVRSGTPVPLKVYEKPSDLVDTLKITSIRAPPSPFEHVKDGTTIDPNINMYEHVYLSPQMVMLVKEKGVPYPEEWFMVTQKNINGVKLSGSMGGSVMISRSDKVIRVRRFI